MIPIKVDIQVKVKGVGLQRLVQRLNSTVNVLPQKLQIW